MLKDVKVTKPIIDYWLSDFYVFQQSVLRMLRFICNENVVSFVSSSVGLVIFTEALTYKVVASLPRELLVSEEKMSFVVSGRNIICWPQEAAHAIFACRDSILVLVVTKGIQL